MDVFEIDTIKSLMDIMTRIYDLVHEFFILASIILVFGGIYAFTTQSRHNSGFLGLDTQKHGRGLGVSMFFSGVVIGVLDVFISVFTYEFAANPNAMASLSLNVDDLTSGADSDVFVLVVRLAGLYVQLLGYVFVGSGVIRSSMAGSVQVSGVKVLLYSLISGIPMILIGFGMVNYTGN